MQHIMHLAVLSFILLDVTHMGDSAKQARAHKVLPTSFNSTTDGKGCLGITKNKYHQDDSVKQARAQKVSPTPSNSTTDGKSCNFNKNKCHQDRGSKAHKISPTSSNSTTEVAKNKYHQDEIILDGLTSPFSFSFYNDTAIHLPKSSKTFGLDLDNYCSVAQAVLTDKSTSTSPIQISFQDFTNEQLSGCPSLDLPIQQHVGSSTAGGTNTTVMCKLVKERSLKRTSCVDINKKVVRDLERRTPMLKSGKMIGKIHYDIVFENILTYSKHQWLDPMEPYPSIYVDEESGKLHIVSKEFTTASNTSCSKQLMYCQSVFPSYLRDILLGKITPPSCVRPRHYNKRGKPVSNHWTCPSSSNKW